MKKSEGLTVSDEEFIYRSQITYEKSEQEWLIKRKNATSYFEEVNNGLISTSGFVKTECLDDCFVGITIKSIEAM